MPKKQPIRTDWDREYIKYRLRSEYGSMVACAACFGVDPSIIKRALRVPYPRAERVIAVALQTTPETIWPSRYSPEVLTNPRLWRRAANLQLNQSSTAEIQVLVDVGPEN
jgi:Ner family transcriptional regulator